MKKGLKALLLVMCAIVLVVATVFGTLAYMTATSNTVKNTFSVGNIEITMDEAQVDANGQATEEPRVTENSYKLIAGKEYDKDPTIHVAAGSDDSYLFVKITNDIASVINDLVLDGWTKVEGYTDLWKYDTTVKANDNIVVFDGFSVKATADNDALSAVSGKTIELKAFAIQLEEVDGDTAAQQAADTLGATAA